MLVGVGCKQSGKGGMEVTGERGTEAVEVEVISVPWAEGKSVATGLSWLGKGCGGSRGATCCNFPPLPEGVILLAVFKCRPGCVQTLKSLA